MWTADSENLLANLLVSQGASTPPSSTIASSDKKCSGLEMGHSEFGIFWHHWESKLV